MCIYYVSISCLPTNHIVSAELADLISCSLWIHSNGRMVPTNLDRVLFCNWTRRILILYSSNSYTRRCDWFTCAVEAETGPEAEGTVWANHVQTRGSFTFIRWGPTISFCKIIRDQMPYLYAGNKQPKLPSLCVFLHCCFFILMGKKLIIRTSHTIIELNLKKKKENFCLKSC